MLFIGNESQRARFVKAVFFLEITRKGMVCFSDAIVSAHYNVPIVYGSAKSPEVFI